ncbi:hypothetical protein ACTFIW_000309 [Dictyostelium discoideum]
MENETTNKKLKENLSENNDNSKIIVLPLIIQKQIFHLLYEELKTGDCLKNIKNYTMVNWNWFNYYRKLFNHFVPHVYDNNNNNNDSNKFKIVHNDFIKTIIIDYFEINNKSINYMNSLKSLETVNVGSSYENEYSFKNSVWLLTYLNKLNNKDIIINFELNLACFDPYEPTDLEHIDREEFKFKTNLFYVVYDCEYKTTYGYLYEMIKELNPKYLRILPISTTDSGASHFRQYHSISKLNQNYESVEIIKDYIPLYALYRFLQSPNLHTLKFDLQFHFLSSIYGGNQFKNDDDDDDDCGGNRDDNNNNNNSNCDINRDISKYSGSDNSELDFNKMDNFKFRNFDNFQGDSIDDGINEDDRTYCSYSRQGDSCMEIPPYSMSLWKQCLKLLSTNSTITNLSISHNCNGGCQWVDWDGEDENGLYDENFLNDFMNSLASNKTIKTLIIDFNIYNYESEKSNIHLINKSIASMLDQNTTLESIHIFIPNPGFNEISNLTKNTKCKITTQ